MKIVELKLADLNAIFRDANPKGLFLAKSGAVWFALDNRTGCPVEMGFPEREMAVAWLQTEEPKKQKGETDGKI